MIWRNWMEHPPTLPNELVEIAWEGDFGARYCYMLRPVLLLHSGFPIHPSYLQWRPTGLYREEFYRVSNRWE